MKVKDLELDETVLDWLININASENTRRSYLTGMQEFTAFIGKTPEELLEEARREIREGLLPSERKVKRYINRYRDHLEKKGDAPCTIKTRLTPILSFYGSYDIDIPKRSKKVINAKPKRCHMDIPTKDDIGDVLDICDPLEKAMVLIGVSSGLSMNEISNLRIRDFKKGYDPETKITTMKLRREKTDYDFITFLTPEASKAVLNYLDFRNREAKTGRRRKQQLEKQRITSDDGYLFIGRTISDAYLQTKDEKLRKMATSTILAMYRRLAEDTHKNADVGTWNVMRSHNLRKFFNSTLINAGAQLFFIDYCMGHKIDALHEAYFRADPMKMRDIYQEYVPYLTIEKETDFTPQHQAANEEIKRLKSELEKSKVERYEIQKVKDELDKRQKEIDALRETIGEFLAEEHIREEHERLSKEYNEYIKMFGE